MTKETKSQQAYYAEAAASYDESHMATDAIGEHEVALRQLSGYASLYGFTTLLDVGSGTGRVLRFARSDMPAVTCTGVEPIAELRDIGYKAGLRADELIEGDANRLPFPDNSFDVVTAFGMLHHVPHPDRVIGEMLRVAKKAIFISDSNNFGQGSTRSRLFKKVLRRTRMWRMFDYIRTKGKGYHWSEGDGVFYSYSVFQNYQAIERATKQIFVSNTRGSAKNLLNDAETVSLLGLM